MFGKKMVKRALGCLLALTMAVTGFPLGNATAKNNSNIAYADEVLTENDVELTTEEMVIEEKTVQAENDSVRYIAVGGSTPQPWICDSEENELTESDLEGVYTLTFTMPVYDENAEWINRFKILRHDEDLGNGWEEQLCLGTNIYACEQTNIRVENTEETEITVYFHPSTGAVVILDDQGNNIDYTFSWVGMEGEVDYFTVEEFGSIDYVWPEGNVHAKEKPDIKKKNDALLDYILNGTPIPSEPDDTEEIVKKNKIRFHFQNGGNWDEVGGFIYQGIDWGTNVTDNCAITVLKDDGEIKKLWPGARCTQERENWYTCTATFTDSVLTDGIILKFNNLVADSTTNATIDEQDLEAILASGLKTTLDNEKLETNNVIISDSSAVFSGGKIPKDLYVLYDGVKAVVTDIAPESYLNASFVNQPGRVRFHFQNAYNWDEVGAWIYQGIAWDMNVTDDCLVTVEKEGGEIKKLFPGARCIPEKVNWYTCTATFTKFVITDGMVFIFNNLVADATPNDVMDDEDIKVILESGLKISSDLYVKEQTNNIIINKKNPILADGVIPTDLYVFYDGNKFIVSDVAPESYLLADTFTNKYIDGVLYNYDGTELIRYPVDKKGKFTIPESVTSIREGAFWDCVGLTELIIPANARFDLFSNGNKDKVNYMFKGCINLKSIKIKGEHTKYKTIDGAIYDNTGKELLYYPIAKESEYVVPENVQYMENYIFDEHTNMIIYGKNDSYAKQYAEENGLEFRQLGEINSTGVDNSVEADASLIIRDNQIDSDVTLNVKNKEKDKIKIDDKIKNPDVSVEDVKMEAYDITLKDNEDANVQPNGTVVVKIKTPEGIDGENCKVYYLDENGEIYDMDAYYLDGYMYFYTNHFSTYLLTDTELIVTEVKDGEEVVAGDANGDGNMDIKDSAIIKRYLAGWDVEIDMTAADMDGDGKVTIKDSALIKRQLAGWE